MQYLAAHYWQSANQNASTLVLQQAYHKRRKLPVLLACICTDAQNDNTRKALAVNLTDWFYESGLPLCGRVGEKGIRTIGAGLETCLRTWEQNTLELQVAGVLCVGNSLWFFQQGGMRIRLLNMRNHRPHSSDLQINAEEKRGLVIQEGNIQPGVGILLATKEFYDYIPRETMRECLNIRELRTQGQLERRVQELGRLGEAKGGTDMGAVMLVAK